MRARTIRTILLSTLIGTYFLGMSVYADTYGKINSENVRIKAEPIADAIEIDQLEKDQVVRIGNQVDEYIEVILSDDAIAYVEGKYVDQEQIEEQEIAVQQEEQIKEEKIVEQHEEQIEEHKEEKIQEQQTEKQALAQSKVEKGKEVINFAIQYVGNPYVYGGNSLTKGTDCSGFTSSIYKKFGVSLQRSSRGQYASNGKSVKKSELKAGDLVFYGYNGRVNHVAIYMGDGKIVHASTEKTGICISPLWQRGMAPYIGAKRVIE